MLSIRCLRSCEKLAVHLKKAFCVGNVLAHHRYTDPHNQPELVEIPEQPVTAPAAGGKAAAKLKAINREQTMLAHIYIEAGWTKSITTRCLISSVRAAQLPSGATLSEPHPSDWLPEHAILTTLWHPFRT
jgi:hypothetical protein